MLLIDPACTTCVQKVLYGRLILCSGQGFKAVEGVEINKVRYGNTAGGKKHCQNYMLRLSAKYDLSNVDWQPL